MASPSDEFFISSYELTINGLGGTSPLLSISLTYFNTTHQAIAEDVAKFAYKQMAARDPNDAPFTITRKVTGQRQDDVTPPGGT